MVGRFVVDVDRCKLRTGPVCCVLIVDDDKLIRSTFARILLNAGVQRVDEAPNGEACLALLDADDTTYDFIAIDQVSPGGVFERTPLYYAFASY